MQMSQSLNTTQSMSQELSVDFLNACVDLLIASSNIDLICLRPIPGMSMHLKSTEPR